MLAKLFRKIHLFTKPIKKGDVLMGDCSDFNIGMQLNQIKHGLRSLEGNLGFTYWVGQDTYRLTVLNGTNLPYYILDCEILTRAMDDSRQFIWKKRTRSNKILKSKIHAMILEGKLKRN